MYMSNDNVIEVHNVTKSFKVFYDRSHNLKEYAIFRKRRAYEEREVLKGISFDVKKGEAVGLIGHNGCGKSTTLKLLTKIMYPDSGSIVMKGRVSSLIELGAGFHPDMSGRENIYINASIFGLSHREINERLDDIIQFSELREYIDNPVRTYSSGMYMRLAFAVAINVNADILLVDEILAVGDANFQAKCLQKMRSLKESGVTIVLVSHDSGVIKSFCDRAIWINDGKIVADGKSMNVEDEYLAYMNAQRYNDEIEKSEANSSENTDIKDNKIIITKSNTKSGNSSITSAKHFGSRKVVLSSLMLCNSMGKETAVLREDEAYEIIYKYHVNDHFVKEINIGMGIFDIDGKWIFGTNTVLCNTRVIINGDEGTVHFHGEPLHLLSGEYILQVAIVGMDQEPYDYHQEYKHFQVLSPYKESGIIHYNTKWTVENGV